LSLSRRSLAGVVAVGAGLAGYQVCYFAAVHAVGVSVATLVTLGLAPVLVAVGSTVFFGEKVGGRVLVALVGALCGLTLLVWDPSGGGARPETLSGAAFAAGSALGYAGVTLLSRSLSAHVDPFRLTLIGFPVGAVVLLPLAAHAGLPVEATPANVVPLLYLGIVPTAAAYGLFFVGLCTVRPAVASILTLLEPLTATVLAGLIFGERLGAAGAVGGTLLLSAVVVLYAGRGRE
jgi:DME family drug/metabolite transporter